MEGMTRGGLRLAIIMGPCIQNLVMSKQYYRAGPCDLVGWGCKPWEWSGE